jgi:hypothetical protein
MAKTPCWAFFIGRAVTERNCALPRHKFSTRVISRSHGLGQNFCCACCGCTEFCIQLCKHLLICVDHDFVLNNVSTCACPTLAAASSFGLDASSDCTRLGLSMHCSRTPYTPASTILYRRIRRRFAPCRQDLATRWMRNADGRSRLRSSRRSWRCTAWVLGIQDDLFRPRASVGNTQSVGQDMKGSLHNSTTPATKPITTFWAGRASPRVSPSKWTRSNLGTLVKRKSNPGVA